MCRRDRRVGSLLSRGCGYLRGRQGMKDGLTTKADVPALLYGNLELSNARYRKLSGSESYQNGKF